MKEQFEDWNNELIHLEDQNKGMIYNSFTKHRMNFVKLTLGYF